MGLEHGAINVCTKFEPDWLNSFLMKNDVDLDVKNNVRYLICFQTRNNT